MYQLNQHRHPSALPPPLLVIVILTTLLTIPGLAWPSEGPTHSSHYDQLKDSIAALSAEVNSIVSIIDTLKTLQGRTPQTAPHQSHHLQTTIQGLTKKVATLQTQVQGLGGNLTHLTKTVDALALEIRGRTPDTGVTETISKLSKQVGNLDGKVESLTSKQDSHLEKLGFLVVGAVLSLASVWAKKLIWEDREQEKEKAKERLEKFYAPVMGRLRANRLIWANFKTESGILNKAEKARIDPNGSARPKNILEDILHNTTNETDKARAEERLKTWVAVMEGIFRQNNEAAEETILENFGFLTPEDLQGVFYQKCNAYLLHVGEFKAILHRWAEARTAEASREKSWFERCQAWKDDTEKDLYEYFHPKADYPQKFLDLVEESYSALIMKAGLPCSSASIPNQQSQNNGHL